MRKAVLGEGQRFRQKIYQQKEDKNTQIHSDFLGRHESQGKKAFLPLNIFFSAVNIEKSLLSFTDFERAP